MYWVDLLSPHVLSGSLPAWNPGSALGHPLLIQRMNLMLFLPAIVLKALAGSTEAAAKIYLLLGHTLSGLGFYYLARLYTRRRSAAAFAALLFLVAPVHVSELCLSGHWSVAQSYALSPVVLGLIVVTVREEGRRGLFRALLLGGAAAWLAWADNERTATLVPLTLVFAAWELFVKDARARYGAIGRLGLAAVVAACLSAGFLLPAFLDRNQLMLSGVTVPDFGFRFWNTSSPPFELWHPALAVDHLWSLSRLPFFSGMMHPIAHVHLGWIPILLAAGAVFQAGKSGGERGRLVLVLLASSLLLVQASMGSNTILGSTYESLRPFVGATFAVAISAPRGAGRREPPRPGLPETGRPGRAGMDRRGDLPRRWSALPHSLQAPAVRQHAEHALVPDDQSPDPAVAARGPVSRRHRPVGGPLGPGRHRPRGSRLARSLGVPPGSRRAPAGDDGDVPVRRAGAGQGPGLLPFRVGPVRDGAPR